MPHPCSQTDALLLTHQEVFTILLPIVRRIDYRYGNILFMCGPSAFVKTMLRTRGPKSPAGNVWTRRADETVKAAVQMVACLTLLTSVMLTNCCRNCLFFHKYQLIYW